MIINIVDGEFVLQETDDFKRLSVNAQGITQQELGTLAEKNPQIVTSVEEEHLWIHESFLLAGSAEDQSQYEQGVGAMLAYAEKAGWYNQETQSVRTHVENLSS